MLGRLNHALFFIQNPDPFSSGEVRVSYACRLTIIGKILMVLHIVFSIVSLILIRLSVGTCLLLLMTGPENG